MWILAPKLPNSDLKIAVDFCVDFFLLTFPRKKDQKIHQKIHGKIHPGIRSQKNSPRISAEAFSWRNPYYRLHGVTVVGTACVSECALKTPVCRGLRVGPSKFQTTMQVWELPCVMHPENLSRRLQTLYSEIPPVLLGIPWPALRGPLRNHFWKKKRPQPYWGGESSGNPLEASNASNYRAWGIPAVLSREIPGNALRAFPGSFRNLSGISSGKVPAILGVWPIYLARQKQTCMFKITWDMSILYLLLRVFSGGL